MGCAAAQPPPSVAPSQSEVPVNGGTISYVDRDVAHFDLTYGAQTYTIPMALAFDSLLGFRNEPGMEFSEMVLRPEIAERWEVSPDARTFTFHLRQRARFWNTPPINGREITAADVKWSFEYQSRTGEFKDAKLPAGLLSYMFEGLEGIETPSRYTVVVRFKEPFGPFINYAGSEWNPIFAREVYERDGHLKDQLAGSGPYILDTNASQKGSRLVWKRHPDYWDAGNTYVDELRGLILPERATSLAAFQTKQLHVLAGLGYQEVEEVKRANPDAVIGEFLVPRGSHAYISQSRTHPFNDIRVRRALAYAIDRDEIMKVWTGGKGGWALPAAVPSLFTQEETRQMLKFDLEAGRRLMAEAGYPNGLELEWYITQNESPNTMALFQLLQAQMKRVGLNATFKPVDLPEQRRRRYTGDHGIDWSVGALGGVSADIDYQVYGLYHSESPGNWAFIKDPELDKLLVAQRREPDPAKRREILRGITRRIVDQAWAVEGVYTVQHQATQPNLMNYRPHLGDRADNLAYSWVKR